jgi:hypothetical protein
MGSWLRDIFTGWEYIYLIVSQWLAENGNQEKGLFYVILCARFGLQKWEAGCAPHLLDGIF